MDFSTLHPVHGALAGVLVYAITGKPLPALVVGGGLYAYMSVYGHNLPLFLRTTPAPEATHEIPLMPDTTYRPISHDPMHPTTLMVLG